MYGTLGDGRNVSCISKINIVKELAIQGWKITKSNLEIYSYQMQKIQLEVENLEERIHYIRMTCYPKCNTTCETEWFMNSSTVLGFLTPNPSKQYLEKCGWLACLLSCACINFKTSIPPRERDIIDKGLNNMKPFLEGNWNTGNLQHQHGSVSNKRITSCYTDLRLLSRELGLLGRELGL